jgi:hypothetical protein
VTPDVHVAFIRIEHAAEEVLRVKQWMNLGGFFHRDHLEIHTQVAATRLGHLQPVEPLWCVRQHDAARQMDTAVLARLGFDLLIQVHRILLQLGNVRVTIQCVHTTGSVPGAAVRELASLEQHDVCPPRFGEVIEHAGTNHTTADHHHLGAGLHS